MGKSRLKTSTWLVAAVTGVVATCTGSMALAAAAPKPGDREIQQAYNLVEPRFEPAYERNCTLDAPFPLSNGKGGAATPAKLFDNFFYVGRTDVGAWLIKTSDGLVLIDTLYNPAEAEQVVVAGIRKLGLDPDAIKMVLITHNHGDHAGGMSYFQKKGVPILVSQDDWGALGGAPNPAAVLHDRQVLIVGDTKITVLHTPGHTPGTISVVFPVTQDGQKHMAVLMGGVGPRGDVAAHRGAIDGLERMLQFGRTAGVDVMFQIHEMFEDPIAMQAIIDAPTRKRGQLNALVLGQQRFQTYGQMLQACWRARIAILEERGGAVGRGAGAPQ